MAKTDVATEDDEPQVVTEAQKIEKWRQEELERAGYPTLYAKRIAARHSGPEYIDLHKALELVKNGADPSLAASILL